MRFFFSALLSVLLALAGRSALAQEIYRLPAAWSDDRGQAFALKELQGSWTALTMAYGACRRICSTSLRSLEQVQALADKGGVALNFVVVSLDPTEDKPADWAAFRQERKLTRPNWRFLSGDTAGTQALAQRLGVRYWRYGEHTMHDFRVVLINPQGQVVRSLGSFDDPVERLLP
jgi:cytochrome oxidase Cu insertion factor (SCO1/SenC/PrrC family)